MEKKLTVKIAISPVIQLMLEQWLHRNPKLLNQFLLTVVHHIGSGGMLERHIESGVHRIVWEPRLGIHTDSEALGRHIGSGVELGYRIVSQVELVHHTVSQVELLGGIASLT